MAYFVPVIVSAIFFCTIIITRPDIPELLVQKESDTMRLASYISENTGVGDVVLSDYAGLNFLADRASIPEASIIAGGKIAGGIITGDLLIRRIEEYDVQMVLIHVDGGIPPPRHMVALIDYDQFRSYLQENFVLATVFGRAGQQIEIHERR